MLISLSRVEMIVVAYLLAPLALSRQKGRPDSFKAAKYIFFY